MRTLYSKDSKGELRVWSIYTDGPDVVVKHGITSIVKMSLTTTVHSLNKKRSLD